MTARRPAPDSFAIIAPEITQAEAIRLWRIGEATAKRWAHEHGVAFKPHHKPGGRGALRMRPHDFTAGTVRGMTVKAMLLRWRCGKKALRRWFVEIGVDYPGNAPRAPKPIPRAPSILYRPAPPRRVSTPKVAEKMAPPRSTLPDEPCFRCGARGWCGHDFRIAELAA